MKRATDPGLDAIALEPPYRGAGQTAIGRLLDQYGLPFFYEQRTLILNEGRHEIWRPDFTLPSYHGLVIEYAGASGDNDTARREAVYAANQISALFLYQRDLPGQGRSERVIDRIRQAGEEILRPDERYGAAPAYK